jgi:hypothetical protein
MLTTVACAWSRLCRERVKQMKTKWGACNIEVRRIWLNLELAHKPVQCLDYVIVHEMAHLLERHHNDRFTKLMDSFMPPWQLHRAQLNRTPLSENRPSPLSGSG